MIPSFPRPAPDFLRKRVLRSGDCLPGLTLPNAPYVPLENSSDSRNVIVRAGYKAPAAGGFAARTPEMSQMAVSPRGPASPPRLSVQNSRRPKQAVCVRW
jgi:hypothetical protein